MTNTVEAPATDDVGGQVQRLLPGLAAGTSLGLSDVLAKVVLKLGCDVLTMLSFRSVVGLVFMAAWLGFGPRPSASPRQRWFSLGVGVMFAALIYCLFRAIDLVDVPTAILSYFIYPLLTGLCASAVGLEKLRWQGVVCALIAFLGLAVMIGAHPAGLALAGIAFSFAAACCRTGVLLTTRAYLVGVDARLTTWYSLLSSTALFIAASFATRTWNVPPTAYGLTALVFLALILDSLLGARRWKREVERRESEAR